MTDMKRVMANFDLKREDGMFENLSPGDLSDTLRSILDDVGDKTVLTVYVELRHRSEFKEKDGRYKLKGPNGA